MSSLAALLQLQLVWVYLSAYLKLLWCRYILKHIFIINGAPKSFFISLGYRLNEDSVTYQASYNSVHY